MVERAGDWQCPNPSCVNHTRMVFGSKANCPKCGAAQGEESFQGPFQEEAYQGRFQQGAIQPSQGPSLEEPKAEKGMRGGDMAGDWQCPNSNCMNHTKMVFAKHLSCPACSTARNAKQPGDWLCPNVQCVNSKNTVFASKPMCPKCGSPRPGSLPMMMPFGGCGGGAMRNNFGFNPAAAQALMNMAQQTSSGNPGDWRCPNSNCLNNTKMVFARHESCPKCGANKSEQKQPVRNLGMGLGMLAPVVKGRGGANPGDWRCPNPDCLNNRNQVFAKHDSCPNCGTEKPTESSYEEMARSRSPYRT